MLTQRHRGTEKHKISSSSGTNIERQSWQVWERAVSSTRRRGGAEKKLGFQPSAPQLLLSVPLCLCVRFSSPRPQTKGIGA